MAVIEPDQITVSHGTYYELRDADYRLIEHPVLRESVVSAALRETTRFFRRD